MFLFLKACIAWLLYSITGLKYLSIVRAQIRIEKA